MHLPFSSGRARLLLLMLLAPFAAAGACTPGSSTTAPRPDSATTEVPTEPTASGVVDPDRFSFERGDCEFQVPQATAAECGWLTVPRHWDDPSDPGTIELHLGILSTDDTPPDATPVVYLEGGPGGDALGLLWLSWSSVWRRIAEDRPVVMFSQRGSAFSSPDLECEEVTEYELDTLDDDLDDDVVRAESLAVLADCAERLRSEGADFAAYHTVASAHDIEALRQALGHEQWPVIGVSYGTRLGLELLRQHPEGVSAMVLDSVMPTSFGEGSLTEVPQTARRSLDLVFSSCAADAACATEYPDLEARFERVLAALDQEPIDVPATNPLTGDHYLVSFDGDDFLGMTFQALYRQEAIAALPELVSQLEDGRTELASSLMSVVLVNAEALSVGMHLAIMCHDYFEVSPLDAATSTTDDYTSRLNETEQYVDSCDLLGTGAGEVGLGEPVSSDVPTLVLAGEFDPITPPSFAESVLDGLSVSRNVLAPGVGHGVISTPCGQDLIATFIADPSARTGGHCVGAPAAPRWVPSPLTNLSFVPVEGDGELLPPGVVPDGWTPAGFGTWTRADTHRGRPVALVQQQLPSVPPLFLIATLSGQLGAELEPGPADDVGGRSWSTFRAEVPETGSILLVRLHGTDDTTLLVAVETTSADEQGVLTELLPDVLAAVGR